MRIVALSVACLVVFALPTYGYTPKERERLKLIRTAVVAGIEHGKKVEEAAEQARIEADNANKVAGLAVDSAQTSDTKAKLAEALEARQFKEFQRAAKENAEMRPIVAQWKKLQGPWWFPGLKGLLHFAGKSFLSLIVIIVGAFVLFLIIKIAITMFTGGTFGAGLGAVTGIFGKLGRWFGRAFKRFLSFFRRREKSASELFQEHLTRTEDIEHRTIGSDPPNE